MELRDIGKDDPKIRRFFGSGYVNLMAISLLIIRFIQYGVSRCAVMCSDWQACELCLNYSYGFIKRSLLGTLVSFFANDLNIGYERSIIGLMIMEEIIFTIVLLAFVLYLINKYKDPTLNLCLILLLAMNVAGFYYYDWGEPDLLMISFTLAACLLIVRGKFLWVVPLLASLCVLIHEGFVMMYFGIIIAVLLVKSISGDNNARIKYVSLLIITGFVCSALFIYLHFATQYVINVDVRQLLDKAHQIFGNDNVNCDLLYYSVWNVSDFLWNQGKPTTDFWYRLISGISALIVCIPLVIYKIKLWKHVILNEPALLKKLGYLFCSLLFLLTMPLIILHTDLGRWFYDIVLQDFLVVIFLYMMDNRSIKAALADTVRVSKANVCMIVIYFFVFSNPSKQFIDFIFTLPIWMITGEFVIGN